MKNWKSDLLFASVITCFIALLSFQSHQQKKLYRVEAPVEFWIQIMNAMEFTKNNLKVSDLPSRTTTTINDSLFAPFQAEVSRQINIQIELEKKKADTAKPKK